MKRAVIIVLIGVLGALYLYSSFAPDRQRRNRPLPFAIGSLRKVIHAFLGIVLLLGMVLLMYGAFLSMTAED